MREEPPEPGRLGLRQASSHMDTSHRDRSFRAAILVGVVYLLIGRLFALPADHVRMWRLAAWALSGAAYAAHIGYERFKLRSSARSTAMHAALAVAIGAFALAVAGMFHSLWSTSGIRASWLVALVVWPLVTGVPALLVALVAGAVLSWRGQPDERSKKT